MLEVPSHEAPMKDFLKTFFAVVLGLCVFSALSVALVFGFIALVGASAKKPEVPTRAVLVFDLGTNIPDHVKDDDPQAASIYNNENRIKEEGQLVDFFKQQGLQVTTPDVDAFRKSVQTTYLNSDYAKVWPKGLLERVNQVK